MRNPFTEVRHPGLQCGRLQARVAKCSYRLGVALLAASIAACGGGGGDDEDDADDFDVDPTGIWTGTDSRDGGASVPATVVVAQSGRFVSISSGVYLSGTGTSNGNAFSASATGWAPAGSQFANGATSGPFTLNGTAFEQSNIDSTYSGNSESGTLTLSYDVTRSDKGASNALVNGDYTNPNGGTLTVSNGTTAFNSGVEPGCTGTGTIQFANASVNVYTWTMNMSGCSFGSGNGTGVGLVDNGPNGPDTRLRLLGTLGASTLIFVMDK